MKKQIILFVLISVCAFTRAQEQSKPFVYQQNPVASPEEFKPDANTPSSDIYDIPVRAIRDFNASQVHAKNVKWVKQKTLSLVLFDIDDIKMMSVYNNKGRFIYTIRYLKEKQMPRDLRHQVKSAYYDYKINIVIELFFANEITYIVKMEDASTYKTLRIQNGEMQVFENFDK